jgi:hypothetical protein
MPRSIRYRHRIDPAEPTPDRRASAERAFLQFGSEL